MCFKRLFLAFFIFSLFFGLINSEVLSKNEKPYYGTWSNGKGEVLTITEKAFDKDIQYKDISTNQNGNKFLLEITKDKTNGYYSKYLDLRSNG